MRLVQSVLDFPPHAHSQSLVDAISFGIDDHLEALWQAIARQFSGWPPTFTQDS